MLNSGLVKRFGVNAASILLTAMLVCLAIISTVETSRAQKDGRTPAAPGLGLTSNKVERVGNMNYPAEAESHQLFGILRLLVTNLPNGALKNIHLFEK